MEFWPIFFTILKVLGFIVGGIIVLALLILLLLRFGHIHYKAFSTYKDDKLIIRIRVSIFYPLLFIYLDYIDDELVYDARILWFSYFYKNIFTMEPREGDGGEKVYRLSEESRSIIDDILEKVMGGEPAPKVNTEQTSAPQAKLVHEDGTSASASATTYNKESLSQASPTKKKRNFFSMLTTVFYAIPGLLNRLNKILSSIRYYIKEVLNLFRDEQNKEAVRFVWNAICNILEYVFDHRHIIKLEYGNKEPDTTAKYYGYICAATAYFGMNTQVSLYPGEQVFELDARCNDYARIYPILWWVLDLIKNDKLMDIITKIS